MSVSVLSGEPHFEAQINLTLAERKTAGCALDKQPHSPPLRAGGLSQGKRAHHLDMMTVYLFCCLRAAAQAVCGYLRFAAGNIRHSRGGCAGLVRVPAACFTLNSLSPTCSARRGAPLILLVCLARGMCIRAGTMPRARWGGTSPR